MNQRVRRRWAQVAQVCAWALAAVALPGVAAADDTRGWQAKNPHWVATWATASKQQSLFDGPLPALNDVTLRQIVRISVGGPALRVWLTNEAGTAPLTVSAATVALRDAGSAIVPGSGQPLKFGGSPQVTIAPGARVRSDPVPLRVPDRADLAISVYLPDDLTDSPSPITYHVRALQTSYIAAGNQAGATDLDSAEPTISWFFLAGVEVASKRKIPVIVAFGDSITDGDQLAFPDEPVDQNARYTDFLAELILNREGKGPGRRAAVVNAGISGNQLTATFIGENGQARFDRDVLTQTGVSHVIALEGINDIGLPTLLTVIGLTTPGISAETIIAGHQQLVARARARGLTVVGGTLTPSGGSPLPGYSGPEAEAKRQAVNAWIRTSGGYDVVVDFDAALRDPDDPTLMRSDLTADGLHPNTEGYRVMAQAVFDALFGSPD